MKNLPATQETRVGSLGWEDPLEKGVANHFSILGWGIPRIEKPGGLQYMGLKRAEHDQVTNILLHSICLLFKGQVLHSVVSDSLHPCGL